MYYRVFATCVEAPRFSSDAHLFALGGGGIMDRKRMHSLNVEDIDMQTLEAER